MGAAFNFPALGVTTTIVEGNFILVDDPRTGKPIKIKVEDFLGSAADRGLLTQPVETTPDTIVEFDQLTPTTGGVVFTPNTPATESILYVSTVDASTWIYEGGAYITKTYVTSANTPFYLLGTTVDAGGNKTAAIQHLGPIRATKFTGDGLNITGINAANLATGTIATIRMGTGAVGAGDKYLADNNTWKTVSSNGVFGISNSSGVYTYYATLPLAMASAVSGDTVEMFADYTETGAVTVTFPLGVSLQGNGHTYKHTHASATHTFKFNQSDKYNVKNLTIERTNATAGAIVLLGTPDLYGGQPAISVYVIADGLTIKTNRYATYGSGTTVFDIVGANIFLSGSGQVYSSTLKKCTVYGDSLSTVTIVQNSTIHNTNVYHLGNQPALSQCYAFNSTVTATLASVCSEMIEVANCYFICGSGTCVAPSGMSPKYSNSLFIAASGVVFGHNSGYCEVNNCTLKSYTNVTVSTSAGVMFNGCRFIAYGSAVVDSGNAYYSNCSFYCYYNNAGGHAFTSRISAINFITNCDFRVTNASANCIYAASATTNKYSGCNFIGATTPVHANITQGISNTQDSQGNILI